VVVDRTSTFGSVEALRTGSAQWRPPAASSPKTVRVPRAECRSELLASGSWSLYSHVPQPSMARCAAGTIQEKHDEQDNSPQENHPDSSRYRNVGGSLVCSGCSVLPGASRSLVSGSTRPRARSLPRRRRCKLLASIEWSMHPGHADPSPRRRCGVARRMGDRR
jgi:hypothetical protein